jgi:FlaG/FlaF family flagellin (archaellin)
LILGYQPDAVTDHDALVTVTLLDVEEVATLTVTGTGAVEGDEDDDDDDTTPDGDGLSLSIDSIDFGVVDLGDEQTYDVLLTNVGVDDVLVVDVYSEDDVVSGSGLSTPQVISSGSEKTLTVSYTPDDEVLTDAALVIQTDLHGDYEINVTGEGVYNEPPDINVGSGPAIEVIDYVNCDFSQSISVQNQGGGELNLTDVYVNNDTMSTCGSFSVSWDETESVLGPWESTTVNLTYTATELCIEFSDTTSDTNVLHFLSDDPDEADYQVGMTVIVGCLM